MNDIYFYYIRPLILIQKLQEKKDKYQSILHTKEFQLKHATEQMMMLYRTNNLYNDLEQNMYLELIEVIMISLTNAEEKLNYVNNVISKLVHRYFN